MNRRTVLAGCALSTTLAGCLDGASVQDIRGDTQEYEECYLIEISYEWLPDDVRTEVDTALDEGSYEAERVLFAELVDVEESYLVVDDTPYEPRLETDNGTERLELTEVEAVRAPEPYDVRVENSADEQVDVHVELLLDETIANEDFTLSPGQEETIEATDRFGPINVSVDVSISDEERTEHGRFRYDDKSRLPRITITEDDVEFRSASGSIDPCEGMLY